MQKLDSGFVFTRRSCICPSVFEIFPYSAERGCACVFVQKARADQIMAELLAAEDLESAKEEPAPEAAPAQQQAPSKKANKKKKNKSKKKK